MGGGFDPMAAVLQGKSLPQAPRFQGPQLPRIGGQRGVQGGGDGGYVRGGPQAIQGLSELVSAFAANKEHQVQRARKQVESGLAAAAAGLPVDKVKLAKAFKQTEMGEMMDWKNPVESPSFQMDQPGAPPPGGQPPQPQQQQPQQPPMPEPQQPGPPAQAASAQGASLQGAGAQPPVPMSPGAQALMGQPLPEPPPMGGMGGPGGVPPMTREQVTMPGAPMEAAGKAPGFFGRVAESLGIRAPYVNPNSQGGRAVANIESQTRKSGEMGRNVASMKQYAEMGDLQNKIGQNAYNAKLLDFAGAYASRQWPGGEKVSHQDWMRLGDVLGSSGFFKDYKPADMLTRAMLTDPEGTAAAYGAKGGSIPMHAFLMHNLGLDETNKAMAESATNLIQSGMSAKDANTAVNELYNGKAVSVALPKSDKFKEQAAKNLKQFQEMYSPQDENQQKILTTVASRYPMAIASGDWGFVQNLIGGSVTSTGLFQTKGKLFEQEMARGGLAVSRGNLAVSQQNANTAAGNLAETKNQNAAQNQGRMIQNVMDVLKLNLPDEQKAVLLQPILAQGTGLNVNRPKTVFPGTRYVPGSNAVVNWFAGTPLSFSNSRVNTGQPPGEAPASQTVEAAKRMIGAMDANSGTGNQIYPVVPNPNAVQKLQAFPQTPIPDAMLKMMGAPVR